MYIDMFTEESKNEFGKGVIYSVCYDTAWLARIPAKNNLTVPAYPDAISWLLAHQNEDGTWRSNAPSHVCDTILNTLATVLALAEWPSENYRTEIEKAISGLKHFIDTHGDYQFETIGFEMLLPSLIHQCQNKTITLPANVLAMNEKMHEPYLEKMKLINAASEKGLKPQSWWFSAEMLGDPKEDTPFTQHYEKMISQAGSVFASPSATAFIIAALRYRRIEVPRALNYIENIIHNVHNLNSLPNVSPIDEFETVFSLNYFYEAGMTSKNPLVMELNQKAKNYWLQRDAKGMGYSTHVFNDPDCTANMIMAMHHIGESDLSYEVLLHAFNGEYIETYPGERIASVSSNIHTLQALQLFKGDPQADKIIHQLITWLNTNAQKGAEFVFTDKWHYSPIYPTSRAVFALMHVDESLAKCCVDTLLTNQFENGGFGAQGFPSTEETAFAILALSAWHHQKAQITPNVFRKALSFLNQNNTYANSTYWIGKVLYCPRLVVASVITAARSAALDCLPTIMVRNEKLQMINEYDHNQISPDLLIHQCQQWIDDMQLKVNPHLLSKNFMLACISAMPTDNVDITTIYACYSVIVITLDDILDESWQDFNEINTLFDYILAVIKKEPHRQKNISDNIKRIANAYADILKKAAKINQNINPFIDSIEHHFQALVDEFNNRKNNVILSIDNYLAARSIIGGMDTSAELSYLLLKLDLSDEMRNNPLFNALKMSSYKALILANDLVSFQKETNFCGDNFISLYQIHYAVDHSKAANECAIAYNQEINQFFELKDVYNKNNIQKITQVNHFNKIAEILGRQVQANLEWIVRSKRYD